MNQKIVLEQPAVREKELFRLLRMDENDEDNAPAIRGCGGSLRRWRCPRPFTGWCR